MIGRRREQSELERWLHSGRPEFIVVHGRRRVGKTHLVREYFRDRFAFRATGIAEGGRAAQLRAFGDKLREFGGSALGRPRDWFEAFARLRDLLSSDEANRDPVTGRLVVFIDEMPWLDTPRSGFKAALEYFWNDWGCDQSDLMLIACGSSTSWLTKELLRSTEGLYGRVTGTLALEPFTLAECEELLESNNVVCTRPQVIEYHLVFGGIPYYLNMIRSDISPAQNVDAICFAKNCPLGHEFDLLFRSLFKRPEGHMDIVRALGGSKGGSTYSDLAKTEGLPRGASLDRALADLVLCGFVQLAEAKPGAKHGNRYRLTDPFSCFHLTFMERRSFDSWASHVGTPAYYAWRGNAFELACIAHVRQIKAALGIGGVETSSYPWRSAAQEAGAQIDLVIDRRDGIIDLCEMKFSDAPYALDKGGYEGLVRKREAYLREMRPKKAVHLVLVAASGVAEGPYRTMVQAVIDGDALFGTERSLVRIQSSRP